MLNKMGLNEFQKKINLAERKLFDIFERKQFGGML